MKSLSRIISARPAFQMPGPRPTWRSTAAPVDLELKRISALKAILCHAHALLQEDLVHLAVAEHVDERLGLFRLPGGSPGQQGARQAGGQRW